MSTYYNAPVTNPPPLIVAGAGGDGVQNLGTLVVGASYLITLQNALAADRGGAFYSDSIDGWIKTGLADDVAVELGDPIGVNIPVLIGPIVVGKQVLSFIRSTDTSFACKVFVVRVS
jgi:hypothetical protein